MKDKKKTLIKYLVPVAIGIALAAGVGYYCYSFLYASWGLKKGLTTVIMAIADGTTVTALLYVGFGLLLLVASTGVLDIIGYGFKSLVYLFTPYRKNRAEGGFYEYKLKQKEKRKAVPFHILWIGLCFLAVAAAINLALL